MPVTESEAWEWLRLTWNDIDNGFTLEKVKMIPMAQDVFETGKRHGYITPDVIVEPKPGDVHVDLSKETWRQDDQEQGEPREAPAEAPQESGSQT